MSLGKTERSKSKKATFSRNPVQGTLLLLLTDSLRDNAEINRQ